MAGSRATDCTTALFFTERSPSLQDDRLSKKGTSLSVVTGQTYEAPSSCPLAKVRALRRIFRKGVYNVLKRPYLEGIWKSLFIIRNPKGTPCFIRRLKGAGGQPINQVGGRIKWGKRPPNLGERGRNPEIGLPLG